MSSHAYDYLDGNAAAGELTKIFSVDVTVAEGQCAPCGAEKRFCRGSFIYAMPRRRGEMRQLRTGTTSFGIDSRSGVT
jgi:hypothetical protein